jgi:hypothetical protein
MPTTGFLFDKLWYRRVDKPYNSYYGNDQRQRLYKQALYYALEDNYNNLSVQGQYDEIRDLVKTNRFIIPINDEIVINTQLPDYLHYIYSEAEYSLDSYTFIGFSYNGVGTIKAFVDKVISLRTGDFVKISGCPDMNEVNGDFYLKLIGRKVYELYKDKDLTIPVTSTIFYGSSATAVEYRFGKCMILYSDQRIQTLDNSSKRNPKILISDNVLKIEPSGCTNFRLDYVAQPTVFIDPTNNTFDLETIYPMKFLYQIIDKAAQIFDIETKDPQSFQADVALANQNQ